MVRRVKEVSAFLLCPKFKLQSVYNSHTLIDNILSSVRKTNPLLQSNNKVMPADTYIKDFIYIKAGVIVSITLK